jgi:hypothetical protein
MFTITLTGAGGHQKPFKMQYLPRGNSFDLAIHLPYFEHHHGKVGKFSLKVPTGESEQISLVGEDSFTTTERVKLSHHRDGTVLFSQDARVLSLVRTNGVPVTELNGHFFTFQFGGLEGYKPVGKHGLNIPNKTNATVYFGIDDDLDPAAIAGRVVGWCYPRSAISISSSGNQVGDPRLPLLAVSGDHKGHPAIILAPLNPPNGADIAVVLTYHEMQRATVRDDSALLVIGGFHVPRFSGRADGDASFIGIKYAARDDNWDDLVRQIGSIDYLLGLSAQEATEIEPGQLIDTGNE